MKYLKKLIKVILLLILTYVIVMVYNNYDYNEKLKECFASKYDGFISNCGYHLSQEDTKRLYTYKLNTMPTNVIRNAYLLLVEDEDFNNKKLNLFKQKVLKDCYDNYGCDSTYIMGYEEGYYGFKPNLDTVNEAFIHYMDYYQDHKKEELDFVLENYYYFIRKYNNYENCDIWNKYYTKYLENNIKKNTENAKERLQKIDNTLDCKK